jgi:hypothetical protein
LTGDLSADEAALELLELELLSLLPHPATAITATAATPQSDAFHLA